MNIKFILSRGGLLLAKYSPEILMGAGIAGIVGSTILSCRATLKAQKVIAEAKEKKEVIRLAWETTDRKDYTAADQRNDLAGVYTEESWKLIKLYAPAIFLGALSISCLVGSHNILSKRNAGLAAAYKLLDEGFKQYRKNVVFKYGKEEDNNLRFNVLDGKVKELAEKNEDGSPADESLEKWMPGPSMYAKWFDEDNVFWRHDVEHNVFFLRSRQSLANTTLQAQGHLFLNELWDMLGIPRTREGAVAGWIWRKDNEEGDDYIDFGLDDVFNNQAREFINGYKKGFLIDPNVQGIIHDLI